MTVSWGTLILALALIQPQPYSYTVDGQDVPFLESPEWVVEKMLDLAEVSADDVVYDLGAGDGRIVIAAARRGARGVGIEIDPDLVKLSEENARNAGVEDRTSFITGDIFESDFHDATVVALFLYAQVNRELRPIMERQLPSGTRVVSHRYPVAGWNFTHRTKLGGRWIYLYQVP